MGWREQTERRMDRYKRNTSCLLPESNFLIIYFEPSKGKTIIISAYTILASPPEKLNQYAHHRYTNEREIIVGIVSHNSKC